MATTGEQGAGASTAPAPRPDPLVVTLLTTEHFTLQGARAATISEAIGRATLFIGAVSSVLVALGFLGQASHLGGPFYAFAFVALPTAWLVGVFTFVRTVASRAGLWPALLTGAAIAALSGAAHLRFQRRRHTDARGADESLFPSPPA